MTRFDGPDLLCEEVRDSLSALLDGAADPAEAAAVRHHLDHCLACTRYERALRDLDTRLRRHPSDAPSEDRLWAGVRRQIDVHGRPEPGVASPRSSGRRAALRWGVAAALAGAFVTGAYRLLEPTPGLAAVLSETARDFTEFRQAGAQLDVASDSPAGVYRWMMGRVDFDVPDRVAGPPGLSLVGGRLCSFLGRRVAFFAYRGDAGTVALYVTQSHGLDVPGDSAEVILSREDGLVSAFWSRDGLTYVAISDLSARPLAAVIDHFGAPG